MKHILTIRREWLLLAIIVAIALAVGIRAPVFLSLRSEQGPVEVFGPDGQQLARIQPGGEAVEVRGLPIRVASVLPASGILGTPDQEKKGSERKMGHLLYITELR